VQFHIVDMISWIFCLHEEFSLINFHWHCTTFSDADCAVMLSAVMLKWSSFYAVQLYTFWLNTIFDAVKSWNVLGQCYFCFL